MNQPDEEAPEADIAEQAALANPADVVDADTDLPVAEEESPQPGTEVPEWDAAEQSIAVPLDDDRLGDLD